jgi:hypothetical protein
MVPSSIWVFPARLTLLAAILAPISGCSASDPDVARQSGAEATAQSSAADTAHWTAAYVGDAHEGSIHKQSNIRAKAALVMATDDKNLYLAVYFCGKGATLANDTKWLVGQAALPPSGNIADLGGVHLKTADGWSAYVNMSGPGTVTRDDGTTFEWIASYVGDGSTSGLYRYVFTDGTDSNGASLAGAVVGFIQWNGGSQGAVEIDHDARVLQVTPVNPAEVPGASGGTWGTFVSAPAPVRLQPVDPIALAANAVK